ncbi:hypothetical protein [Nocardia pseudovaccinii]|uniref:hypothetical protein n=1 Tax=Nocardia pseudovaccinii TaxID=189540 RepID=UPI0007A40EAF|nr:hypothetical protein [Nocardia pseudovaccinii]
MAGQQVWREVAQAFDQITVGEAVIGVGRLEHSQHSVRERDAWAEPVEDIDAGVGLVFTELVVELDRLVQLYRCTPS